MKKAIVLTGITPSGTPHLGNYIGAIRPAIEASMNENTHPFYFLADYHALIKCQDPERVHQSSLEIAATWLALGLNTDNAVFYRQSDVPEILELTWLLTCVTAKGLMNRAHAYKAAVADNEQGNEQDADKGITMGLFSYPILMAADILLFNANRVPVGKDQVQHLEMARDIASRFNYIYGDEFFTLPEAVIDDHGAIVMGLDGRKMSKSYNNTIPLFEPPKKLQKLINKIKTNSQEPHEPKDPTDCTLFGLYQSFANEQQVNALRERYAQGIGWGEMKSILFEQINAEITPARERYEAFMQQPQTIEAQLQAGAKKARALSQPLMARLRRAVGIYGF